MWGFDWCMISSLCIMDSCGPSWDHSHFWKLSFFKNITSRKGHKTIMHMGHRAGHLFLSTILITHPSKVQSAREILLSWLKSLHVGSGPASKRVNWPSKPVIITFNGPTQGRIVRADLPPISFSSMCHWLRALPFFLKKIVLQTQYLLKESPNKNLMIIVQCSACMEIYSTFCRDKFNHDYIYFPSFWPPKHDNKN